tara:strand:+ start:348 stop:584 length:237 start_codon:yes stop_codon:yes gene_type:complete
MNFKTLTIILGVVVASIVLGTSVISGDPFGKVTAINATHQPDAELKRDAFCEPGLNDSTQSSSKTSFQIIKKLYPLTL